MNVQIQQCGAVSVVKPDGPLTLEVSDDFKAQVGDVIKSNLGRVVVDTSAVPYVDSRGLEVLVDLADELTKAGHALKLCAVNATVEEVFNLTGLAVRFERFDDTHAAVRSFL